MESDSVPTSIHPSSNRLPNRDKVMIRCLLGHLIGHLIEHTLEYDRVSTSIHESSNRMYNNTISTRASRICYRVSTRVYDRLSNTAFHMVYNGI